MTNAKDDERYNNHIKLMYQKMYEFEQTLADIRDFRMPYKDKDLVKLRRGLKHIYNELGMTSKLMRLEKDEAIDLEYNTDEI